MSEPTAAAPRPDHSGHHAGSIIAGLAGGTAALAATSLISAGARLRRTRSRHRDGVGRGIVTGDGQLLHSRSYGPDDASTTVVLAHGWTMSSAFWTATAEALARKGLRVVTYDQRGHGRSTQPGADGYDLAHLGRDLQAVLDARVPLGHPVVLVGHSMGAMSVMSWAGQQDPVRHRVLGAVLANTSAHAVVPDALGAISGTTNPVAHQLLRQAVRVAVPIPHTPVNHAVVRLIAVGSDAPAHVVGRTYDWFRACPPAVRVGFARQIDVLDLRHGAASLRVPTLVIAGTEDRLTPPAHAQALVDLLPDATLTVLAGVGHQAPLERPAEVVEAISGHVRAVARLRDEGRAATP